MKHTEPHVVAQFLCKSHRNMISNISYRHKIIYNVRVKLNLSDKERIKYEYQS